MSTIHGSVDPKFQHVKSAFASIFADGLEHGAAVAVMVDGHYVVDLWGGHADAAKTKPWTRNTIANVWSCTKGVMAAAVAMLVEQGKLKYDAPIANIWPEFAAGGKEHVTLDQVMSHTSGLNGVNVPISEDQLLAWTPYVEALAAMTPNWQPGKTSAYHALSYGHLTGEPIRRVTGKSPGEWVSENISKPLGIDFYIGLPEAQDHRAAEIIEGNNASAWVKQVLSSPFPQACANPTPVATSPNHRKWRAAEIPGGNGHSDARSLSAIYGDMMRRQPMLMRKETVSEASRIRFRGLDESFQSQAVTGAGFQLEDERYGKRASAKTIGHAGWGGSIAFGDPDARLSFAFVTCKMQGFDTVDPRLARLVQATYDAL